MKQAAALFLLVSSCAGSQHPHHPEVRPPNPPAQIEQQAPPSQARDDVEITRKLDRIEERLDYLKRYIGPAERIAR